MNKVLLIITVLILLSCASLNAENLTLEKFIILVEKNSKDLKLAKKDLEMADAYTKEAWATVYPKVFATANYRRNIMDNIFFVEANGEMQRFKLSQRNEYGFNAVLNQTLFSFKIGAALKAAEQFEELTNYAYDASYQMIITLAKKGFYQTLLLKKIWELAQASEQNALENYENGLVSEFDLLQAEVRWQNHIPQTTGSKKNYEMALANLKNFAGIEIKNEINLQGDFDTYPASSSQSQIEEVLDSRPDFNAMLWENELKSTNISAVYADYFPYLSGNVIYDFSARSDNFNLENRNSNIILGLTVSIPIYTGGYTGAQYQKAKVELDKSNINIEKSREKIYNELNNIELRLKESSQRIQSAEKTKESASKAFKIAEISAENGLITQLELKETRVLFDQAQLNYYFAVYDYLDAYFDLERATGKVDKN